MDNSLNLFDKSWHIELDGTQRESDEVQLWLFYVGFKWCTGDRLVDSNIKQNIQSIWNDQIWNRTFSASPMDGSWTIEKSIAVRREYNRDDLQVIIWSEVRDILVEFNPFEKLYNF
jgi:hypothetical protein